MTTGNLLALASDSRLRAPGLAECLCVLRAKSFKDQTITSSKDHQILYNSIFCKRSRFQPTLHAVVHKEYGQAARLISTSQLKVSLPLHTWPINLVVFQEPLGALWLGKSHLVEGFTLRCIQRFSLPDVATRHCHWRDNRYTRGPSNPVLSY